MKKKFGILSLSSFILSAILFVVNYIFYHYTGDDRANGVAFMFTPYHDDVQKPFITDLIGQLATNMLAVSIVSLMILLIFFGIKRDSNATTSLCDESSVTD